jgi:Domain of unknown function (DUF4349)
MKRIALVAVGFLVLAGLIGFVVRLPSGGGNASAPAVAQQAKHNELALGAVRAPAPVPAGPAAGDTSVAVSGGGGASFGGVASSGGTSSTGVAHAVAGSAGGAVSLPAGGSGPSLPGSELVGPRIIETAELSIVTRRGGFDAAFDRATAVAGHYRGGFVESSSRAGVKSQSGQITIRVPSNDFQSALRELRGLGRVEAQSISGQDVTAHFVDLQARLRNLEAQAQALLRLRSRATTVGDTLRIQNELSQVQMRIEELKGQLRVLKNQTSLATIDVSMREAGHRPPPPTPKHHKASTLLQAWRDARHGFIGVVSAVVVGLGYLIPITALLVLVWLGLRRLRPRVAA